jgi:hypothetical protein
MSDRFAVIGERRRMNAAQALALLDAVPSADNETKRSLLSMAGRSITDHTVIGRWVELTAAETDTDLKEALLARVTRSDHRQIPDLAAYIDLMVSCIAESRLRWYALEALSRLVTAYPEVVDTLVHAYAGQSSAQAKRHILLGLSQFHVLPPTLVDFFLSEIDRCDADLKTILVDRLLRRDAVDERLLVRWLAATEPSAVRERVLRHLLDRSIVLEEACISVLRNERRADVRLLALRALTMQAPRSAAGIQALLDALRDDPDPQVRAEAVAAFQHSVVPTSEILPELLQALRTATTKAGAQLILATLVPYASTSAVVRDGLLDLSTENLQVEVAGALYEVLGRLLLWDLSLLPHFLAAYENSRNDRTRSLLLEALAKWPDPDERLISLYRDALKAPDVQIREWAVLGLLRIPLTQEQTAIVAEGVESLLDPAIDVWTRRELARKICRIPDPAPDLRTALEETAAHTDDEDIRNVCRQALARPTTAAVGPVVDLERWYRQVAVEHDVQGIFPDIYGLYDTFPEQCIRILKVAVLDTACRDKLYYNDFPVSAAGILQFLLSRDALDDDLCRYCTAEALTSPGQGFYLSILRSRPDFPELRTAVWSMLESTTSTSDSSRVLLLELMILVYGGETALADALGERIARLNRPVVAIPYLRFLDANRYWSPVKPLLGAMLSTRTLLDADNLQILRDSIRELFPDMNPELRGPGLADD